MATRGHSDDPVRIKNEIIEHEVWIMLLLIFFSLIVLYWDCPSVRLTDWLTDWLNEWLKNWVSGDWLLKYVLNNSRKDWLIECLLTRRPVGWANPMTEQLADQLSN